MMTRFRIRRSMILLYHGSCSHMAIPEAACDFTEQSSGKSSVGLRSSSVVDNHDDRLGHENTTASSGRWNNQTTDFRTGALSSQDCWIEFAWCVEQNSETPTSRIRLAYTPIPAYSHV